MKKNIIIIALLIFGFGGVAFALPYSQSTQTLIPFVDSSYDVGTSTAAYRNLYVDRICLNTDCQTAWPAGGGGGVDPFTHPAAGQSATTSLMLFFGNASTTQFTATSSAYFATSAGKVGIGSTSPYALLSVDGNSVSLDTNTRPVSIKAQSGILQNMFEVLNSAGTQQFAINRFGNTMFYSGANGTGSAGTCPGCGVFLSSAAATNNGFVHKNATNQTGDPLRVINDDNTSLLTITPLGKLIVGTSTTPSWLAVQAGGATAFGNLSPLFDVASTTSSSYATSSLFRINADGNVGVASTSPYKLLSVGGDVVVGASTAGGTLGSLYLSSLGTPAGTIIAVDASGKVIATTTSAGGVTAVTGAYPVTSTGGASPTISLAFGTTTSNTWAGLQTFGNATTSLLTVSGSTWLDGITSALMLTGSTGLIAEYTGTSCTNQFVRSLSALGAATCATVGSADVSLAELTATDGTLTFSGTYTGATARTIGVNLASINSWTGGQTFANATTTGTLAIPVGATVVTPLAGNMAIDTTTGQLRYSDVNGTARVVSEDRFPIFGYSTTTAWTGTTTLYIGPAATAQTWKDIKCETDAGFIGVSVYDGTNRMNYLEASSTIGTVALTTNNSFTIGESRRVDFGTSTATTKKLTCTGRYAIPAD